MRPLLVLVCLVAVAALATTSAFGLEINVGPKTLVLSSGVQSVTVHTDCPYWTVEKVQLFVGETEVPILYTWANSSGNLVVRCSKDDVAEVVVFPEGASTTTAIVTLSVNGDSAWQSIVVRK